MQEDYCPICGKRRPLLYGSQTIQHSWGTTTIHLYSGSTTESYCFGHEEPSDLPVGGLKDLQCRKKIPQAFYDAFEHEELQP